MCRISGWLLLSTPNAALAQEEQPESTRSESLMVYTEYPSQMIGIEEMVTLPLRKEAGVLPDHLFCFVLPCGQHLLVPADAEILIDTPDHLL